MHEHNYKIFGRTWNTARYSAVQLSGSIILQISWKCWNAQWYHINVLGKGTCTWAFFPGHGKSCSFLTPSKKISQPSFKVFGPGQVQSCMVGEGLMTRMQLLKLNFWGNVVSRGNFQAGSDMSHLPSNTARAISHFLRAIRSSCWPSSFLPAVQIFINQLDSLYFYIYFCWVSAYIVVTPSFPDWLENVVVTWWLMKEYGVLFPQDEVGQEKQLWEKVSATKYRRSDSTNCKGSSGDTRKFNYMPEKKIL